jgi:hypothetical protein
MGAEFTDTAAKRNGQTRHLPALSFQHHQELARL